MRIYLFALLPLMVVSLEVEKAPTARGMGPPDSDLLNPVRPKGKRKRADEETDDYNDVETQPIKNKDNSGLKSVTYAPITQAYDIPKYADVSTLSPIAEQYLQSQKSRGGSGVAGGNGGRVNQPRNGWSPAQERRKGYYFMHYPWNMLPKAYRIRPSYQFYYPTQYQNTVYSYPSNPYSDPYGVYRQLIPCGSPGGYCGYQGYGGSGCGGGSCGGGCGGGGSAGGCGDSTGYSGDNDSEETEEGDEDETTGGKSGETKINKADPLDDLDLEDLEKLDKDKGDEKEGGVEEDVEKKKKKRKNH